ncbi:serine hydroxymethyltransferase [Thermoactinospora rubra]|uniref:serine hydroxymethyltransferase n=1 Tax=Thermoactinospora rubra TaxID=1088767 RepID=UPI000A1170C8|nr:serine hydroxymethyltransferase [Thermoactinospora rubra]
MKAAPKAAALSQSELTARAARALPETDPVLYALLDAEVRYQNDTLAMVAHASLADPSVLACGAAALSNVTAEGYPGDRYHPGCAWLDEVESLAVDRAKAAFRARYANVQPHSCSSANLAVLFALLRPGDPVLGLDLDAGGHLTHGSPASVVGRYFTPVAYGVGPGGLIDYDQVRDLALRHRPKVLIAGASAYPRTLDYAAFRAIADEAGAYLLADISHIAGLVAGGVHPSPIDHAHITTTSTYKQLGGPRGGLILMGRDSESRQDLVKLMQRAVFPRSQGTLNPAGVAAKARALDLVARPEFAALARRIAADAAALADALAGNGHRVVTGGTDTHMVLLDLSGHGLTGAAAEQALESCGILANRNRVPGDRLPARVTSGLRLGTNILAQRGLTPEDMHRCADLVCRVLKATKALPGTGFEVDPGVRAQVSAEVADLCAAFPISAYAG